MTTLAPPRSRESSFLRRHHSGSVSKVSIRTSSPEQNTFEGTDAVTQNRRVAVQRIVEIHDALELQQHDLSRISSDRLSSGFDAVDLPAGEVRAFRYFLRKWDHNGQPPDPEFDEAVQLSESGFDEAATKHFIRRVALWHESEQLLQAARNDLEKRPRKGKKGARDTRLGKLWIKERSSQEHTSHDELKEVTTREGLAQLLWTLMHDQSAPLAPELVVECTEAVKKKYGIIN
ncbi:hypothetical protein BDU57DRAFT_573889 [Ampelomyces quisqualis]|uniref:Uncharacterized protein n=1 Tax=Ampelomyces quisqualis TaxID=50730 RepID=A0A6A5QL33_AMPQU|nr:hypothetical protein BDU57DRAFT_573889 [Ampelomyces quisqualis]